MRKVIGCFAAGIALLYFASWAGIVQNQAWWAFPSVLVGVLGSIVCVVVGGIYLSRHLDGWYLDGD